MSFFSLIKHSLGIFAANSFDFANQMFMVGLCAVSLFIFSFIYDGGIFFTTAGLILFILNLIFYCSVQVIGKRSNKKQLDNCLKYISSVKKLK